MEARTVSDVHEDIIAALAGVPQIMRGMLEAVAKAHPGMSLGSYPFYGDGGYGSNLVLRGRDEAELDATVAELIAALEAGVKDVRKT